MKKIRTLLVRFDNELQPWEVSAFRGAVIEKVGYENLLFNHHIDDKKYLYRYPVIQYKSIDRKPAIFCIGEGVDEIHKLFNRESWEIKVKGRNMNLTIDEMKLSNHTFKIEKSSNRYRIYDWLALNAKNFKMYRQLSSEIDQLAFLERKLIGNILAMAKGIDWHIDQRLKMRIHRIHNTKKVNYKNTRLLAFDLDYQTNVSLPGYIGLGKGVSRGYGVLSNKKNKI